MKIEFNKWKVLLLFVIFLVFVVLITFLYSTIKRNINYKNDIQQYKKELLLLESKNNNYKTDLVFISASINAYKDSIYYYKRKINSIKVDYEKEIAKYNAYSNDSVVFKFNEYIQQYRHR